MGEFIETEGHVKPLGDEDIYNKPTASDDPTKPKMSGFQAYAKQGFDKIGEPQTTKKRRSNRLGVKGEPQEYSPINPNARILSKSKRPVQSLYTTGKNKGKTKEQVMGEARKFYDSQPQSYKDAWDQKANAYNKLK